jgi:hypothetical protein
MHWELYHTTKSLDADSKYPMDVFERQLKSLFGIKNDDEINRCIQYVKQGISKNSTRKESS